MAPIPGISVSADSKGVEREMFQVLILQDLKRLCFQPFGSGT